MIFLGMSITAWQHGLLAAGAEHAEAKRTHCRMGHELSGYNAMQTVEGIRCRCCSRRAWRKWQARR